MPQTFINKDGSMYVKVGEKDKHVVIPDGWEVVTRGVACKGDKYLYCGDPSFPRICWNYADEGEDVGEPFDMFDVLIREKLTTP